MPQPQKTKTAPKPEVLHATFYALAPGAPGAPEQPLQESRSVDVVASTPTLDRCNRVVVQDWDLSTFEKNPVVFWNHAEGGGFFGDSPDTDLTLPIGSASNVRVEDDKLLATLTFVDAAANPLAEKVYQGMRQGSIRAVSVGWLPHDVAWDDELGVIVCRKNELLEISPVAIPANPEAVRTESARLVASLQHLKKDPPMLKQLVASLRLQGSTNEAEALAAVDSLIANSDSLTKTLGVSNLGEAVAAVAGLKASAAAGAAALADLEAQAKASKDAEFAAIVEQGEKDGKLTPANKASFLELVGDDVGKLKALLAHLPVVANRAPAQTPATTASAGLTKKQLATCKQRGWDPTEYAAHIAAENDAADGSEEGN